MTQKIWLLTISVLACAVAEAQPLNPSLSKPAPEQLLHTQLHLFHPIHRLEHQGELGISADDSFLTLPKTGSHRILFAKSPDDGNEFRLLQKAMVQLELKLKSTDSKKERAKLEMLYEQQRDRLKQAKERQADLEGRRDKAIQRERETERQHDKARRKLHEERERRQHEHQEPAHGHGDHDHDAELQKIHALHEAAERLEKGGIPDLAHQLHRQAEEIEKAMHRNHNNGAHRILIEVIHNMDQLRREVKEINERLDKIMKKLDGNAPVAR